MKKYSFQVNLNYDAHAVSACGLGPDGPTVIMARSLGWLPRRIMRAAGLQIQQIELTFQPEE